MDALLANRGTRIIVCCGSGGVGKTTTAAALALRAAEQGRRVCVLTIDPARRLAQSMGLEHLDNVPRVVPDGDLTAGGLLEAMMLDMKRTFDETVETHAAPDQARAIFANPFYQSMSSSFTGTQEYMAMEKLGQLRAQADVDGRWDLIIVDTPPSRSALDFLDAPQRLGSFLDGRRIKLFLAPARLGGRAYRTVFNAGVWGSHDQESGPGCLEVCVGQFGAFAESAEDGIQGDNQGLDIGEDLRPEDPVHDPGHRPD